MRPRREAQRPLLPQHARHCPVLEAGSMAGFLVHPPLAENEAFQIGYEGEGRYQFVYSVKTKGGDWEAVFTVTYLLPVGGIGATKREIKVHIQDTPETREFARLMPGIFISADDTGTPAGAVTLRGAWNFQTAPGWDTIYTPVFNIIERPLAPMLVIRVETDWYVHDSEFRYVLQPGETISASHSMPIGQVIFVPREEISFRNGTAEEIAARHRSSQEFCDEKARTKLKTPYGLEYSPHYQRTSRRKNQPTEPPDAGAAGDPTG
ncbi:MAG TPA: hypothetical protein VMB25_06310 [Bryobacteraceae bacterium]|nr:hypothetical protein [Bryobacteraceae bacterium]